MLEAEPRVGDQWRRRWDSLQPFSPALRSLGYWRGLLWQTSGRRRSPWIPVLALCLGFFVILLDTTIVNVALPTMLVSLHASLDQVLWVVNAYLLTFAVLLLTAGRLGDIFGPRNLFIVGLGGFVIASAACGLAHDANQLIVARVVQGVAAAVLSPQPLAIVATIFPAQRRGAALGILSGVTAMAALLGPVVGGVLVTYLEWRWIFYVNVPIGLAGIVLGLRFVPDHRPGKRPRLDLVGVALVSAGLLGIVFGLIEGQRYNWQAINGSPVTIPEVIGAGVALIVAFVIWERYQWEPLLPLGIFRSRNFSLSMWLFAVQWFGLLALMFTGTLFFQSVLGMSAIEAGLTITPVTLVMGTVAPFAGRLTDRIGGRLIVMIGFLATAAGMAGVAAVESLSASWLTFALPFGVIGFGMGAVIAPLTAEAMRDVPAVLTGAASGLLNTSRQLGSPIGVAVIGAVLQNRLVTAMHDRALTDSTQLPPALRQAFMDGFANAASSGIQAGRGQSGVSLPRGLPPQALHQVQLLLHDVFVNGFAAAMRPTLLVAAGALLLGALTCLGIESQIGAPSTIPTGDSDPHAYPESAA